MGDKHRIQWHPGFYAGLEFDLRKYQKYLDYKQELELSKKPQRLDCLIIKKDSKIQIETGYGRIFRTYNIVEYKSPDDSLSIDDLYKVISYACEFKSLGKYTDEIGVDDITISLFRNRYPKSLISKVKSLGAKVEKKYNGIYEIRGIIHMPIQLVFTQELDFEDSSALRIINKNVAREDIERFLNQIRGTTLQGDRSNADAVLQVSVQANRETYDSIRENKDMCQALEELLKDEIDMKVENGRQEGRLEGRREGHDNSKISDIKSLMETMKWTAQEAMDALKLTASEKKKYLAML